MNMNKFFKKLALGYLAFCFVGVPLLNQLAINATSKIKNKKDLEIILSEETKKLSLENKQIEILFEENYGKSSYAEKVGENKYQIYLAPHQKSRGVLKHEFYHIFKDDCNNEKQVGLTGLIEKKFKSRFIQEPKAVIYSLTGLKM